MTMSVPPAPRTATAEAAIHSTPSAPVCGSPGGVLVGWDGWCEGLCDGGTVGGVLVGGVVGGCDG